jgi:hypothetical protein
MRDILKKLTTGSMIAGAALLVASCGDNAATNNTADLGNDMSMDANMGDMGLDANLSTDANMVDANMSTDMNTTTTTTTTTTNTTTNEQ